MLAMDQFKDVAGFVRYASRLRVGFVDGVRAWLAVGFDETLGALVHVKLGRRIVEHAACDPELVTRYLPRNPEGFRTSRDELRPAEPAYARRDPPRSADQLRSQA